MTADVQIGNYAREMAINSRNITKERGKKNCFPLESQLSANPNLEENSKPQVKLTLSKFGYQTFPS